MNKLLIILMLIAALAQFGMSLSELRNCNGRACAQQIEKHSRDVLKINWTPISVFPEEARRFR